MACSTTAVLHPSPVTFSPFSGHADLTGRSMRPKQASAFLGLSLQRTPSATIGSRMHSVPRLNVVANGVEPSNAARCDAACGCNRRQALLGLALSAAAIALPAEAAVGKVAIAQLVPTKGSTAQGQVTFREVLGLLGDTSVNVDVDISGLAPGLHGFHIHEIGNVTCDDGLCTGGHFNPSKQPHGAPGSSERHAGDLGNIMADQDGNVRVTLKDSVIRLDGPSSIVGHSVVVHFGQDDLTSQPSGNAGGRAAYATVNLI